MINIQLIFKELHVVKESVKTQIYKTNLKTTQLLCGNPINLINLKVVFTGWFLAFSFSTESLE
jgi:hypothetical protein